jgi:hypothetical protein
MDKARGVNLVRSNPKIRSPCFSFPRNGLLIRHICHVHTSLTASFCNFRLLSAGHGRGQEAKLGAEPILPFLNSFPWKLTMDRC